MLLRLVRGIILATLLTGLCVGPCPTEAQLQGRRGEKYALLVGVRRYNPNELRNLPYSEPDVVELAEVLKAQGYKPGNVVVMTTTTGAEDPRFLPLAANIRSELKLLLADLEEDDSVLIALAGHGVQFRGQPENYFCPADARLAEKSSLIGLNEVYKQLEASRAALKLLLVDACRNDPQTDNSRSRSVVDLESVTRPQRTPTPGGVLAFFSCSEGEKAYEHSELKHGVFFHYVIEGLRGGAVGAGEKEILIPDLEKYVKRNVRDFVREKYGVRQMPELRGTSRDLVPLVIWNTGIGPERVQPKPAVTVNKPGTPPRSTTENDPPSSGSKPGARWASLFPIIAKGGTRTGESVKVGLWVAAPLLDRDYPIFARLADSMLVSGARLVEVSSPKPLGIGDLGAGVVTYTDWRRMLDSRNADVILIYGLQRSGTGVPEFEGTYKNLTVTQRVHLGVMWACRAAKDCFVIIPDEEKTDWSPARLPDAERLSPRGEGDALEAELKYNRIVWVGKDFGGFFKSVKSRDRKGDDIQVLIK